MAELSCTRCGGFLIGEHVHDPNGDVDMLQCLNCGNRLDPMILHHRLRPVQPSRAHSRMRAGVALDVAPLRTQRKED